MSRGNTGGELLQGVRQQRNISGAVSQVQKKRGKLGARKCRNQNHGSASGTNHLDETGSDQ